MSSQFTIHNSQMVGPLSFHLVRFAIAWPWRHGDPYRLERIGAYRPELKACPDRNRDACARIDGHDFLCVVRLAPHLAAARDEVPDLFDRPMCNGDRGLTRSKLEMR